MATRTSMNVSLTDQLSRFVNRHVASGRYQSASEVVREGLRLLQEREADRQAALADVRKKIAVGIRQIERGEVIDGEKVFAELRKRSKARRAGHR